MKKAIPIVVVLLLILTGVFFLGKKGSGTISLSEMASTAKNYTTEQLKDALKQGVPLKCTYKEDENNYGTSYVKGMNIYSEVTIGGKRAFIIMKDQCMWNWSEEKTGMKMCFDTSFEEMLNYDYSQELGEVPQEYKQETKLERNYSCTKANISDSMFSIPSDISFMDFQKEQEQLMKDLPKQGEQMENFDNLPEEIQENIGNYINQ